MLLRLAADFRFALRRLSCSDLLELTSARVFTDRSSELAAKLGELGVSLFMQLCLSVALAELVCASSCCVLLVECGGYAHR